MQTPSCPFKQSLPTGSVGAKVMVDVVVVVVVVDVVVVVVKVVVVTVGIPGQDVIQWSTSS